VKPSIPELPNVARSIIKTTLVGLFTSGLITQEQCDLLVASLRLEDA
jgi:hypothetical protein